MYQFNNVAVWQLMNIVILVNCYIVTLFKKLYFFDDHCISLSYTDTKGT